MKRCKICNCWLDQYCNHNGEICSKCQRDLEVINCLGDDNE